MHKNAQLQTQETILALFIVIILLILGIAVFLRIQNQSLIQERNAFLRSQTNHLITTLPENALLKCSRYGQKEHCIDSLKLAALATNPRLLDTLGYKNITVSQVYPHAPSGTCTGTNLATCNTWQVYTQRPNTVHSTTKIITPISVYRPEQDAYIIGLLTIDAYNLP